MKRQDEERVSNVGRRIGLLKIAVVVVGGAALGAVWLAAELAGPSVAAASQVAVVIAFIGLISILMLRELRRLGRKVDNHLRGGAPPPVAGRGVPQAHLEQFVRLVAANNHRLEQAIDDLSRRLDDARPPRPDVEVAQFVPVPPARGGDG